MTFPTLSSASRIFAVLCLLASLSLTGCGYSLTNNQPSLFGSGSSTMRIREVKNSTIYPWINQVVRSCMYDEITDRNIAVMTASESSDYSMVIDIERFTINSRVLGTKEETLEYTITLTFSATVYDSKNEEIWTSNSTSLSRSYPTSDARFAGTQITNLVVQAMVDKMRNTF
ncbi:LPS assembly lipoprotein LptE [Halodesulfovibrio sp. MK-HDV]|jgi:outer membrane lipopolysaccharide assembly protein LptE/RlpB|uniref:LPS assembly lipoprotein LptE n=1 Tax=unclassified Halodesulfovibrio TaxID=2644657 RepID=UPI00136AB395|nr:LPS assembly lipoprotein LptE [Halodesulfovibrio sp. MK-HDV]KAF1075434.1 LPS-assembly lipoprotein LptE [Halodesulfovibrio sp. MK-HDV]